MWALLLIKPTNVCTIAMVGGGVILCLYVDDILIFGTNLKVIEEVKKISHNFEMKDLGVVTRDRSRRELANKF